MNGIVAYKDGDERKLVVYTLTTTTTTRDMFTRYRTASGMLLSEAVHPMTA